MQWIKKLFGKRASRVSKTAVPRTPDFRSDAERKIEQRAQTALDSPIETIAETVTGLSLMIEAIANKPGIASRLHQLEGYRADPGGFGKQQLETMIAAARTELDEAEDAIRTLQPILDARSVSVSSFDEGKRHLADLGRQLDGKGGFELMKLVAYRCRVRGGTLVYVSAAWDGIGEWKG